MTAPTVWLTGLSGAGKSTLAEALARGLTDAGLPVRVLDGDALRRELHSDLGYSPRDRRENIRRAAALAQALNAGGHIVVGAFISPLRADRDLARDIIGAARFVEVHVSTPVAVCEQRDGKGLYKQARAGLIADFTGVSAPYEAPLAPALTLDTSAATLAQSCERLLELTRAAMRRV